MTAAAPSTAHAFVPAGAPPRAAAADSAAHALDRRAPFRSALADATAATASVRGALPAWLHGRLVRTAPAGFAQGAWRAEHWFDALGMLYAFELGGAGGARFVQRALECDVARAAAAGGRVPYASFGTRNGRGFFTRLVQPVPRVSDNTNVNVLPLGDELVAMTETPHQLAIDPATLAVTGRVRYDDHALAASAAMLAHPHWDAARDRVVNVAVELGARAGLVVYEHAPAARTRVPVARRALRRVPYVHSFGLTPGHAVLIEHPFAVDPVRMLWSDRGLIDHFDWRPREGTRLVALDRATGAARAWESEPCFVFHTVNAFEAPDGEIVLDALAYPDAGIVAALGVARLAARAPDLRASLVRWRLRPGETAARREVLDAAGFEFPAINYRRAAGREHRYVWGAANQPAPDDALALESAVLKRDLRADVARRFAEPGWVFGEPVFVARPGAEEEDDGVVLVVGSSTRDAGAHPAALVVLDAATLEPCAWVDAPVPLPLGFHGSFVRDRAAV